MSVVRGYGYRPDPADRRTQISAKRLLGDGGPLPPTASLWKFAPPVLDQGQTSSCTAHAASTCIYTALAYVGSPLPFVPSPLGIYAVTRAYERGVLFETNLPPLEDKGAIPADVMESVSSFGVRPLNVPTPDGRYSDVTPLNVNQEPRLADVEDDLRHLVTGQYRVDESGPSLIADACGLIAQGIPLFVGTYVDASFENWTAAAPPVGAPDYASPGGGHALAVIGYRTDVAGKRVFDVRNSWGPGWGAHGDVDCSEEWLQSCSDIYAMRTALVGQR